MYAILGFFCALVAVAASSSAPKLKLSSGYEMPAVGLGTSSIKIEDMDRVISTALDVGYRHIDTAFNYYNEAAIGKALKKWFDNGGKREDLFVTSKLPEFGNRPSSVEKYLNHSLKDLGLDYVDMYLIHFPYSIKEGKEFTQTDLQGLESFENVDHIAVWKEMEKQVKSGRAKSIGLSNFNESQILNIYNNAEIKPSNLQVESHAYLQQKELREFCKQHNILMTAYAPLGSPKSRSGIWGGTQKELPSLVELPLIKSIAAKYNKSPAQILLRHTIQSGLAVIPKSSNSDRIKANIDIFDFQLTEDEMKQIGDLDKGEVGRVFAFTAFIKDLDKNPQYPFPLTS
ncbi:hypothetical protein QAD02_001404 [Eretmocerus hayati]|uniref:Uncharacterized protein n=1 Tax=Eretmocerus hayati TaxID=131215 RepID=A0ACC2NG62_9HYME|nr:hypothetical protein QAD02_001404 [Eretmocerus hayati]